MNARATGLETLQLPSNVVESRSNMDYEMACLLDRVMQKGAKCISDKFKFKWFGNDNKEMWELSFGEKNI